MQKICICLNANWYDFVIWIHLKILGSFNNPSSQHEVHSTTQTDYTKNTC